MSEPPQQLSMSYSEKPVLVWGTLNWTVYNAQAKCVRAQLFCLARGHRIANASSCECVIWYLETLPAWETVKPHGESFSAS